ncbi:MAG: hypothetical protein GC162_07790 [Planctomycetes bacterium]|nr:hypothetical protein [Planctomycetota bacterium]
MTPLLDKIANLLTPLSEFYRTAGDVLPHIEAVEPERIPQPQRRLLVHTHDMTPTLEAFCNRKIHLKLLARHIEGSALYREVVLIANGAGTPMEFGAIRIHLDHFDVGPRALIVEGHRPLGTILHDFAIHHTSRPSGYFSIESDPLTRRAFGMTSDRVLYGRHNTLSDASRRVLAEVVEILPPFEECEHDPSGK